jgi:hypothetical protein
MCHYIHSKLNKDWFKHSKVNRRYPQTYRNTEPVWILHKPILVFRKLEKCAKTLFIHGAGNMEIRQNSSSYFINMTVPLSLTHTHTQRYIYTRQNYVFVFNGVENTKICEILGKCIYFHHHTTFSSYEYKKVKHTFPVHSYKYLPYNDQM